ncbi:epoxide hydrolase N terminus-domain-containing protein [Mycena capillaripes]|nr:epoxide hydrolase N terminus-domain-containing protein [Mycena capillaripes]
MGLSLNLRACLVVIATAFKFAAFVAADSVSNSFNVLYPDDGSGEKGIELDVLRELQTEWVTTFDWEAQQAKLNQFKHFTAVIENQTVHFIHGKSIDPDAIPVILLHGWPIPADPTAAQDLAVNNVTLSDIQKVTQRRNIEWNTTGLCYFLEQTTKPNDIGLALYDNPVGQLGWIDAKFKLYLDPRAGTPPSVLDNTAILTSVSLSTTSPSLRTVYTRAPTDAPLLFSQYEYNIGLWPEEYVAKVGNLVSYKVHDFGGHFAGLDNPPALVEISAR